MGAVSVFMVEGLSLPTLLVNWMTTKSKPMGTMYNQASCRENENLQEKHTVPNRRIPIKILIWAVTEFLQKIKNKINKSLVAAWHGTKIVRLYLDYYPLEIYNNNYKIILSLSTEQTKTRWNIPMKGMCTTNGPFTLPSIKSDELWTIQIR